MSKQKRKICIIAFLSLFIALGLRAQADQKNENRTLSDILSSLPSVNDYLYFENKLYLLDRSLMSALGGYDTLYSDFRLVLVDAVSASGGSHDKNYRPIFVLKDSCLFLTDVQFRRREEELKKLYPNNKQYKRIEQLTGRRFLKGIDLQMPDSIPQSPLGIMLAQWVNGVYYGREIMPDDGDLFRWKESPFKKLTFQNGKLIAVETIQGAKIEWPVTKNK